MRRVLPLLFWLTTSLGSCDSARILAVLPFPSRSHHGFVSAVLRALAERGHHVVEFSPYPPQELIPNHTHREIHTQFEQQFKYWTFKQLIDRMREGEPSSITGNEVRRLWSMTHSVCEDTFKNENIQNLINSKENFDLVLTESTFGQESLLVFGHRFSAPTVTVECFTPWSVLNRDAGNALSIASVPDLFSDLFLNEVISFKERIVNFISVFVSLFLYHFSHIPSQEDIFQKYFSGAPPLREMVSNVSLYLTNSQPAVVNFIQPYSPNIIPIGGININKKKESKISKDVLDFISDANRGFIYFSLGTVVPADSMPKTTFEVFINVFKRLPQKVLWKLDYPNVPLDLPSNIKIIRWLPQPDILGHKNCELLVTQGGLFSHHEALDAGVPTVSIPFISDQPYHSQYRKLRGLGVSVDIVTLTEDTLYEAITTVLNNSSYKESALKLSHIYRDRPMTPADSAVFWVEYVLRHRGAPHLRPASAHMTWYQVALLDVFGVILAVLALGLATVYVAVRAVFSMLWKQKNNNKSLVHKKSN